MKCPDLTPDQYSAPLPIIGLYIASASGVCFILMLCDVIHGLGKRKKWFPCRFFSLNSMTLTLLSIVVKIPVDLTTSMPRGQDQLSKLTGTAFLCISMTFFMPSVGASKPSDCLANMIALSILVVSVIVNICIQLSTGVIFSNFMADHVIIMVCMLSLLILLWVSARKINVQKEISMGRNEAFLTEGKGSMLRTLELCYFHAYNSNPQFVSCKTEISHFVDLFSVTCSFTVLRYFLGFIIDRSEFCGEVSDYRWSTMIIIIVQSLVIVLGFFATCIRWQFMFDHIKWGSIFKYLHPGATGVTAKSRAFLRAGIWYLLGAILRVLVYLFFLAMTFFFLPTMLIMAFYKLVYIMASSRCVMRWIPRHEPEGMGEYRDLLHKNEVELEDWILRIAIRDIRRWMKVSKSDSLNHVTKLLSETPPSHESFQELNNQFGFKEGNEASCFYLVFLAKIASVCTSSTRSDSLTQSLDELFHIIHFIDSKVNSFKFSCRKKCKLAKAMWKENDFRMVLSKKFSRLTNESSQSEPDIHGALEIIGELKNMLTPSILDEVHIITDLINSRKHETIEELYDYVEQLFVDMSHIFLIQLPHAIVKEVIESPIEEQEQRVGRMLKFLCQIESLEGKVKWCFPVLSNINSLITTEDSITDHHNTTHMVENDSIIVDIHANEDAKNNIGNPHHDEISQV